MAKKIKRIMIVEDSPDMQIIYGDMFESHKDKYEIEIEIDGRQALKKIKKSHFDLVILDMLMECMSGEDVFEAIRKDPDTRGISILVISALGQEDFVRLKQFGKVNFLQKPFTEKRLIEYIEKIT